jgi:hypothetical protein
MRAKVSSLILLQDPEGTTVEYTPKIHPTKMNPDIQVSAMMTNATR